MQSKAQRNFLVAKSCRVPVIGIVRVVVLIVCVFVRVHSGGCQTRNAAGEAVKSFQRCIGASPLQANRHGYDQTREGSHQGMLPFGITRHNDLYGLQDCIRVEAETLEVIAAKGNKIRSEVDSAKCAPKIPSIAARSPRSQRG